MDGNSVLCWQIHGNESWGPSRLVGSHVEFVIDADQAQPPPSNRLMDEDGELAKRFRELVVDKFNVVAHKP